MMGDIKNPRLFSIQCLIEWLQIREREGLPFPADLPKLVADIDHSALLNRLLEGKQPLPEPPPTSFSHPWYELIEKGEAIPSEVTLLGDSVIINKMDWRVVTETTSGDFLVTYGSGTKHYALIQHQGWWKLTKFVTPS